MWAGTTKVCRHTCRNLKGSWGTIELDVFATGVAKRYSPEHPIGRRNACSTIDPRRQCFPDARPEMQVWNPAPIPTTKPGDSPITKICCPVGARCSCATAPTSGSAATTYTSKLFSSGT